MKKIIWCCLFSFTLVSVSSGQDVHFSQFYNSPVSINPALTGKVNGMFRFAMNYRNQWFRLVNGDTPFETYAGSFDAPIRFWQDAMGVGLVIINDRTGEGRLSSTSVMLSVAYHKALDRKGKHSISVGLQGGWAQKRLDQNKLLFYDQFDEQSQTFDPNSPSGEPFADNKKGSFDMAVGLVANSRLTKKVLGFAGMSIFHLTQPKESFLGSDYKLPIRYLAHLGFEYYFHKRVALLPSVIYMNQNKMDELNLGTAFAFNMTEEGKTFVYIGAYYRLLPSSKANGTNLSDAAIAYTAFEFKNFRVGFSYDATTSSLKKSPKSPGSFEASLMYMHPAANPGVKSLMFCPRF